MTGPGAHPEMSLRRRSVPTRRIGDKIVVARPADGAPVVLAPTAAYLWEQLAEWKRPDDLDTALAQQYPDVAAGERTEARTSTLQALHHDELIERR